MDYVTHIEHASIWLRKSGVYKQARLFVRGEVLFAEMGSGYIRLHASGATSVPTMHWLEIDPSPDFRLTHTDRQPPAIERIRLSTQKAA